MIWEWARMEVRPGQEHDFKASFAKASGLFRTAEGCLSFRHDRSIEHAFSYVLLVGWLEIEYHLDFFLEFAGISAMAGVSLPSFRSRPGGRAC